MAEREVKSLGDERAKVLSDVHGRSSSVVYTSSASEATIEVSAEPQIRSRSAVLLDGGDLFRLEAVIEVDRSTMVVNTDGVAIYGAAKVMPITIVVTAKMISIDRQRHVSTTTIVI